VSFPTLLLSVMINKHPVAKISDASSTMRATAAHKRLVRLARNGVRWCWVSYPTSAACGHVLAGPEQELPGLLVHDH